LSQSTENASEMAVKEAWSGMAPVRPLGADDKSIRLKRRLTPWGDKGSD